MLDRIKKTLSDIQLSGTKRDRMVITFGGALICLLVYVLITAGFDNIDQAKIDLSDKQALLSWMKSNAAMVKQVQARKQGSAQMSGQNSLGAVEASLRALQLESTVQKSEQLQDQKIQISFKQVSFETLIKWLAQLRQSMSLQVNVFSAQTTNQPGMVDAEVVLSLPSSERRS